MLHTWEDVCSFFNPEDWHRAAAQREILASSIKDRVLFGDEERSTSEKNSATVEETKEESLHTD